MDSSSKYFIIQKKYTPALDLQWSLFFGKKLLPITIPKNNILSFCLNSIFFSTEKHNWEKRLSFFFPNILHYRIIVINKKKKTLSIIFHKRDLFQLLKKYMIIEKVYQSIYVLFFYKKKVGLNNSSSTILFDFFFSNEQEGQKHLRQIPFLEEESKEKLIKTHNVFLRNYALKRARCIKKAAGLLFIDINQSNTFCYYSDWKGNIHVQTSSGMLGFKNSNKSSQIATLITVQKCISKINSLIESRYLTIHLRFRGAGNKIFTALETVMQKKRNIKIVSFKNIMPYAFNGTKKPKQKKY